MDWISVKDELPENEHVVLGLGSHDIPWPVFYTHDDKKWYDAADGIWVTGINHWQKLPEPPEEG